MCVFSFFLRNARLPLLHLRSFRQLRLGGWVPLGLGLEY